MFNKYIIVHLWAFLALYAQIKIKTYVEIFAVKIFKMLTRLLVHRECWHSYF